METQNYVNHSSLKNADSSLIKTQPNHQASLNDAPDHSKNLDQFFWARNSLICDSQTFAKDARSIDQISEMNFMVEHKQVVRGMFKSIGMWKYNVEKQEQKHFPEGELLEKWWNEKIKENNIFRESPEISNQQIRKNVNIPSIFYQLLEEVPESFQESYSHLFYKVVTTISCSQFFLPNSKQQIESDIQSHLSKYLEVLAHHGQINMETQKIQKIVYELSLTIAYCLEGFFQNSLLKNYLSMLGEEQEKRSRLEKETKKKYKIVRRRTHERSPSEIQKKRKIETNKTKI